MWTHLQLPWTIKLMEILFQMQHVLQNLAYKSWLTINRLTDWHYGIIGQFHKSQNAPVPYPTMLHSVAFWELWIRSIQASTTPTPSWTRNGRKSTPKLLLHHNQSEISKLLSRVFLLPWGWHQAPNPHKLILSLNLVKSYLHVFSVTEKISSRHFLYLPFSFHVSQIERNL